LSERDAEIYHTQQMSDPMNHQEMPELK